MYQLLSTSVVIFDNSPLEYLFIMLLYNSMAAKNIKSGAGTFPQFLDVYL